MPPRKTEKPAAIDAEPWIPPSLEGVHIDRATMKALMQRSDAKPLLHFAVGVVSIGFYGYLYYLAWGTLWVIPALIVFGGAMSVFAYSLSHECAHGTAFRNRRINEAVFWCSSLIFGQEPLYRRYSHACHHTYTWFWEKDAQMPFTVRQKVDMFTYLRWYLALEYHFLFVKIVVLHALGKFSDETRGFTPARELPRMQRNSIIFALVWIGVIAVSVYFGSMAAVWFYVVPKLVGDMISMAIIATQHFEMTEDDRELTHSTRSIKPNWFLDLYYWNMAYHIEHHYAPMVPYHALGKLNAEVGGRLPQPRGVLAITADIFRAMRKRQLTVEKDALKMPTSH